MRIAGARIGVCAGQVAQVMARLEPIEGIEVVGNNEYAVAVTISATTPGQQAQKHKEIEGWPEVQDVALVYQTGEV